MKKTTYVFGILIVMLMSFISLLYYKNVIKDGQLSYYTPPKNCKVLYEVGGKTIYMDVNGLNSTVFCRRVLSFFEESSVSLYDENFTIPEEYKKSCNLSGEGFIVTVLSKDEIGSQFCESNELIV